MIKEHMTIHAKGAGGRQGAPRVHVGTVDHLDGEKYIKLTKKDSTDGRHHWIPVNWVESINEQALYLNKTLAWIIHEHL
jgi:hypothetical protein